LQTLLTDDDPTGNARHHAGRADVAEGGLFSGAACPVSDLEHISCARGDHGKDGCPAIHSDGSDQDLSRRFVFVPPHPSHRSGDGRFVFAGIDEGRVVHSPGSIGFHLVATR
jgi:hypothetical protein